MIKLGKRIVPDDDVQVDLFNVKASRSRNGEDMLQ